MRVQDVMTAGVKTIAPTAAADDAVNVMRFNGIRHLVVTRGQRVVGVLSDRDAGGRRGASLRMNCTVADLMTAPAVTVEPDDDGSSGGQPDARPLDWMPRRREVWPGHRNRDGV